MDEELLKFIEAACRLRDNMAGHVVHPEDMWVFDTVRQSLSHLPCMAYKVNTDEQTYWPYAHI